MAKTFLLHILVDILGQYVEGLAAENTKLGVWSGKLSMKNLKLREGAFDQLNLPITVSRGSLKTLTVSIPWRSLESKPTIVTIDGIYAQVRPLGSSEVAPELLAAQVKQAMAKAIRNALDTIQVQRESADITEAEKQSYRKHLTAIVLDNLEITISNLHIRYEESHSIPRHVISAGITLDNMRLKTTDKEWKENFVSRRESETIHKLGLIKNIGLYWNTNGDSLTGLKYDEWEIAMHSLIYDAFHDVDKIQGDSSVLSAQSSSGPSDPKSRPRIQHSAMVTYIRPPPNAFVVKLIQSNSSSKAVPLVSVIFESDDLNACLDTVQVQQIMATAFVFRQHLRVRQMIQFRPHRRPDRDPRAWWRYAYALVSGRQSPPGYKLEMMRRCVRWRDTYIELAKRQLSSQASSTSSGSSSAAAALRRSSAAGMLSRMTGGAGKAKKAVDASELPLSAEEEAAVANIESIVPLHSLLLFRQLALLAVKKKEREKAEKAEKAEKEEKTDKVERAAPAAAAAAAASESIGSSVGKADETAKAKKRRWLPSFHGIKFSAASSSATSSTTAAAESATAASADATPGGSSTGAESPLAVTAEEQAEDEELLETLWDQVVDRASEDVGAIDASKLALRLGFRLGTEISLLDSSRQPFATSLCDIQLGIDVMGNGAISIEAAVKKFRVMDETHTSTLSPYVLKLRRFGGATVDDDSDDDDDDDDDPVDFSAMMQGGVPSCFSYTTSQFSLSVTSKGDGARVARAIHMKSSPLEIFWNPRCMACLIELGTSAVRAFKGGGADSVTNSNTIRRFAAEVALPALGSLDLLVEVHAPVLVVPEDRTQDLGCLALDAGVLSFGLQRTSSNKAVVAGLALTGVNVKMPTSTVARWEAMTAVDSSAHCYLVQPFDVNVDIQSVDKRVADNTIVVVSTKICIDLDLPRISRLLQVAHCLQSAFNKDSKPSSSSQRRIAPRPAYVVSSSAVSRSERCLVSATLTSSGILINLNLADRLSLAIENLHTQFENRTFDSTMRFQLSSINLTDSFRHSSQMNIIWAGTGGTIPAGDGTVQPHDKAVALKHSGESGSTQHLLEVNIALITNSQSSHFRGFAAQIDSKLHDLRVSMDAAGISRLEPLVALIMKVVDRIQRNDGPEVITAATTTAATAIAATEEVGLVLGTKEEPERDEHLLKTTSISIGCNIVRAEFVIMRTAVSKEVQPMDSMGATLLETVCSIEVGNVQADVRLAQLRVIEVSLETFNMIDKRIVSRNYVHKECVYRSSIASSLSQRSDPIRRSNIFVAEQQPQRSGEKDGEGGGSGTGSSSRNNNSILLFKYQQISKTHHEISVEMTDVTSYLTLDMVYDAGNEAKKIGEACRSLLELTRIDATAVAMKGAKEFQDFVNAPHIAKRPLRNLHEATLGLSNNAEEDEDVDFDDAEEADDTGYRGSARARRSANVGFKLALYNPCIIVLENPEDERSRAVVTRSNVTITIVRDTPDLRIMDTREVANMSINSAEIFVLVGDSKKGTQSQQQILEPFNLDLHLSRRFDRGVVLAVEVLVVNSNLTSKVSLHDWALANGIVRHAKEVSGIKDNRLIAVRTYDILSKIVSSLSAVIRKVQDLFIISSAASNIALYTLRMDSRPVEVTLINDLYGQDQPVLRLMMQDMELAVEGAPGCGSVTGEGRFNVAADYFNAPLASWEPVLESFCALTRMNWTLSRGMVISVEGEDVMQLNISGSLTRQLSRVAKLAGRIRQVAGEEVHARKSTSLMFRNLTGIPLELLDTMTKQKLLVLDSEEPRSLPTESPAVGSDLLVVFGAAAPSARIPSLYDVRFLGELEDDRLPITALPLNLSRPRANFLQPVGGQATSRGVASEPILEIIIENQRYRTTKFKWDRPWKEMGDPPNWANTKGDAVEAPAAFRLPSSRWEWMEPGWQLDMTVGPDEEIDADGWEYATAFSSFSLSKKRRAQRTLDMVRRRKWYRRRALLATAADDRSRQMIVIWDVTVDANGCKLATIRSGLQLVNSMPFSLTIEMVGISCGVELADRGVAEGGDGGSGKGGACTGAADGGSNARDRIGGNMNMVEVAPGATVPVPLLLSHTTAVRLRPSDGSRDWSTPLDCRVHVTGDAPHGSKDRKGPKGSKVAVKDVKCEKIGSSDSVFMQVVFRPMDKALMITCMPYAVIYNHLPCSLLYQCNASGDSSIRQYDVLKAGSSDSIIFFDPAADPKCAVTVGSLRWSEPVPVLRRQSPMTRWTVDLFNLGDADLQHDEYEMEPISTSLQLTVTTRPVEAPCGGVWVEVYVYSRFMLVDRTSLGLSIRTKRLTGGQATMGVPVEQSEVGSSSGVGASGVGSGGNSADDAIGDGVVVSGPMKICERRTYGNVPIADSKVSWVEGSNGVTLFQPDDDKFILGVSKGNAWSEPISLVSAGTSKATFEVFDEDFGVKFQLAYSVKPLPGIFQATQVLTVMPQFTVVNTLQSEVVYVRQIAADDGAGGGASSSPPSVSPRRDTWVSSDKITAVPPGQCVIWNKIDAAMGTCLQVRTETSDWSTGSFDINDIGTSVLALPKSLRRPTGEPRGSVVNVEVKLSESLESSVVTAVFWQPEVSSLGQYQSAVYSVDNETDLPISFCQTGLSFLTKEMQSRCEICVPPNSSRPFGWLDPTADPLVEFKIGTTMLHAFSESAVVDVRRVGPGQAAALETTLGSSGIDLSRSGDDSKRTDEGDEEGNGREDEGRSRESHGQRYDDEDEERRKTIKLEVSAGRGGKVIRVYWAEESPSREVTKLKPRSWDQYEVVAVRDVQFQCNLQAVSMSLIAERPVRRELFNLYLLGIEATALDRIAKVESSVATAMRLKVSDVQLDNHCEKTLYPTLLHSRNASERSETSRRRAKQRASINQSQSADERSVSTASASSYASSQAPNSASNGDKDICFLTISLVKETPARSSSAIYKSVVIRMLELTVAVDSSTLQLYISDLHPDLLCEGDEAFQVQEDPAGWIAAFSDKTVLPRAQLVLVDVAAAQEYALADRLYFESFVLHPIKIRLSYMHTASPRTMAEDVFSSPNYRWLRILRSAVSLDDFVIKLNSFEISDASESTIALAKRITRVYSDRILQYLLQFAGRYFGSVRLLGKPVGLYKNIGNGAKDFFYEPYLGLIDSPGSFVVGVGRGATSLVTNVARGVITSTASVVEGATQTVAIGAAFISGDEAFAQQRDDRRRLQHAASTGILSGLKAGGESVMAGFSSGIVGLVKKPYEEGRKAGVIGVVKGIGLGLRGVVVKPVLGITDGIASVAHGVTSQMADTVHVSLARPARAFLRLSLDSTDLVLTPLDVVASTAQEFVYKTAAKSGEPDTFVGHVVLHQKQVDMIPSSAIATEAAHLIIVISERFVCKLALKADSSVASVLWKFPLNEVSHCEVKPDVNSVQLMVFRAGSVGIGPTIACKSTQEMLTVYNVFQKVASLMGSPARMIPLHSENDLELHIERLAARAEQEAAVQSALVVYSPSGAAGQPLSVSDQNGGLDGYKFGSANATKPALGSGSYKKKEILWRAQARFSQHLQPKEGESVQPADFQRSLDEKLWHLVYEWDANHSNVRLSRCAAVAVINRSENPVQLQGLHVVEGRNVEVFGVAASAGFDPESRVLMAGGGAAVIFAYADKPNLFEASHVTVQVEASAFAAVVSSRADKVSCSSIGGFQIKFLEKLCNDTWSKYVFLIS